MHGNVRLMGVFICLALLPTDFIQAGDPKSSKIADPSNWNVVITCPGGAKQNAYIRLRNSIIYPHPKMNNNASGKTYIGDDGFLHLVFTGHPKVVAGEAVIEKVGPGMWRGEIIQQSGIASFEMKAVK